jgi:hypothetical protein
MPMTFDEFREKMKDPAYRNAGAPRCTICGEILDALDLQEPHEINKKEVCSDCYFDAFGKMIDEQGGVIGVPHKPIHGCGDID